MSLYALKPRFQSLLRPGVAVLARAGISANQVTLLACLGSLLLGAALALTLSTGPSPRWLYALVPVWMLLRMALNAVDGMLAREFGQQSTLGAYLNEVGDVVSDIALFLPFGLVPEVSTAWLALLVALAVGSEFCGVLAWAVSGQRRYDGPMGKSDRAFLLAALALALVFDWPLAPWINPLLMLLCALLLWTMVRRVQHGLQATAPSAGHPPG